MKSVLLSFILLLGVAHAQQTQLKGTLRWTNGDSLSGVLGSSVDQLLVWTNDLLFTAPMRLQVEAVDFIELEGASKAKAGEDGLFRASLISGDVVHGDLLAIDPVNVVLKSKRHGVVRLKREEIVTLRRLDHPSLIFAGPNGPDEFESLNQRYPIGLWSAKPGGGLATKRWRAELFRELELPDRMEAEIVLKSSKQPEFNIAFAREIGDALRIETWGDSLVIVQGVEHQELMLLDEKKSSIHLRLFWDRLAGELSIHSGDGQLLAEMKTQPAENDAESEGFYLRNKSIDMELVKLRIGAWNGKAPEKVRDTEPRIRTTDGDFLYGKIDRMPNANQPISIDSGESITVDQVDTIHFQIAWGEIPDPDKAIKIVYADGALISGKLQSIDTRGFARIETIYSAQPILTQLTGARRIEFKTAEDLKLPEATDELQMKDKVLHGTITGAPNPSSPIRWLPFGGVGAVPLKPDADARLIRVKTKAVSDLEGDRIFLNSREVLSCRVEAIDEEFVHFRTSVSKLRQLPVAQIRAVEFHDGRLQLIGFGDHGWTKILGENEKVTREPDRITLDGGELSHPSILRANEISFRVRWENPQSGGLTVGLFGRSTQADVESPMNISFSCWDERLWVAGTEPGQANGPGGQDANISGGEAKIKIQIDGERIWIWVNDNRLANLTHDPGKRLGNGLRFGVGSPYVDETIGLSKVMITDFEIRSTTGLLDPLRVDKEAKLQALTIPRFRVDNPDTHILIAHNGDLLRGQLIGMSNDLIRFTSRMEEIDFPRDRVAGLISLTADDPDAGVTGKEARVVLSDGSAIRLTPRSLDEQLLIGRSPSLGDCQLPAEAIRQIQLGNFKPVPDQQIYANWKQIQPRFPEIPEAEGGPAGPESELVGQDAAEIQLPLLAGGEFDLNDVDGKIVVLEYWATWCAPCRHAFPEYLRALEEVDSDEVRYIAVNQGEPAAVIQPFLERNQWDFEVALDIRQTTGTKYGVEGIPHTVIIDRNGKIAWVQSGFRPGVGDEFKKALLKLLGEEKPPAVVPAEPDPAGFDF
ncbi:MAG: thiol-disulfide isomerase/thioredoxin [Verrucomicrobiales bacterium]|jgi:thiol-disulfide isomerase/thioredoxin